MSTIKKEKVGYPIRIRPSHTDFETLVELLERALVKAKQGHVDFEAKNGPDADWPKWYAEHMFERNAALSDLLREHDVTEGDIEFLLKNAAGQFPSSTNWATHYAQYMALMLTALERYRPHGFGLRSQEASGYV